jgi:O-antigen ligase
MFTSRVRNRGREFRLSSRTGIFRPQQGAIPPSSDPQRASGAVHSPMTASALSTMGHVSRRSPRMLHAFGVSPAPGQGRLGLVWDPLRVLLCLLTILTISRVHQHYPMLEKVRPALLLVVISVGYAYLNPRYLTHANPLRMWPMRLVAILAFLACLSAVFGISLGGSASFILNSYVKTLAYAFLLALSIRHVRDLFTFVWAYVISCGILSFFSLFIFGIARGGGSYVTRLNNLYTYDSNDLGVVLMVGFPLTLLLLGVERGAKRLFLLVILIGISATMARSGSRGGFLGFVAVGASALILVKGVSAARRIVVVVAALIALVVGAPPGYWMQMKTILKPKEDYNYTEIDGRKAVMERGIWYVTQYPMFGLGIDNFARAECSISPKLAGRRANGPMRCTPPHNTHLQAAAELGIPGFVIWISLIAGGIFGPLRLRRRLPRSWRRGTKPERFIYSMTNFLPVSMIGFTVSSFFVTFAWMDPVYVMAAFLTGLYVATRVQMEEEGSGSHGAVPGILSRTRAPGWRVKPAALRSYVLGRPQPTTD